MPEPAVGRSLCCNFQDGKNCLVQHRNCISFRVIIMRVLIIKTSIDDDLKAFSMQSVMNATLSAVGAHFDSMKYASRERVEETKAIAAVNETRISFRTMRRSPFGDSKRRSAITVKSKTIRDGFAFGRRRGFRPDMTLGPRIRHGYKQPLTIKFQIGIRYHP